MRSPNGSIPPWFKAADAPDGLASLAAVD